MFTQLANNPMLPLLVIFFAVMAVFIVVLVCADSTPSTEVKAALDANAAWQAEHNARMAHADAMSAALSAGDLALYRELRNTNPTINAQ